MQQGTIVSIATTIKNMMIQVDHSREWERSDRGKGKEAAKQAQRGDVVGENKMKMELRNRKG